ncbi:MAG: tyrosine-protein phosphatase [Bacteroidota bacterium]
MKNIIAIVALLSISNACAKKNIEQPMRTFEEDILLEHNLKTNQYEFFFKKEDQEKQIYRAETPEAINWTRPLATTTDNYIQLAGIKDKTRTYFGLQMGVDSFILSERRIALDGASNFRDLGGIRTEDGRYIKWGKIYRSNRLSSLSKDDLKVLEDLGLKVVADFRYAIEYEKHPNRIPKGADYYQYPIGDKEGTRYLQLRKNVLNGATASEVTDMFVGIMEEFSDTATVFFRPIIDHLLAEEVPLVFHCSSGKDRTGYMAAVVLSALGVDRETIMQDYLMSNFYRYEDNVSTYRKGRLIGIDKEVLATGALVKEVYLNKVWEIIDNKYGGTDQYLEQQYGLTPEKRQQLIEMYTY